MKIFVIFISIGAFFFPGLSLAQNNFSLQWEQAESLASKTKNFRKVILHGKGNPGLQLQLGSSKIILIGENRSIQVVNLGKQAFLHSKTKTHDDGSFDWALDLPKGVLQIPVRVSSPKTKESSVFQISLEVTDSNIEIKPVVSETPPPAPPVLHENPTNPAKVQHPASKLNSEKVPHNWVWGGLGTNYLTYSQTSDFPSDLSFRTSKLPTIFLAYELNPNAKKRYSLSYSIAPGATNSSDLITVQSGTYNWKIASADMVYFLDSTVLPGFKTGILGGFQHHQIPFLEVINGATSTASLSEISLLAAQAGAFLRSTAPKPFQYDISLVYQLPLTVSNNISISPEILFNGSICATYVRSNRLRYGLAWSGQLHHYSYSYDNSALGRKISGRQELFYSNLEFRLGYGF